MQCANCGHENEPDASYCSSCGHVLAAGDETTVTFVTVEGSGDATDADLTVTAAELPATMAMVVVKRGPNAGAKFMLDTDVTGAGRHPNSHIFLDDITVSRRHAEILRRGDTFVLKDVGSLNGTYLNRERIEEAELTNGDELQIGKFRLVFFSGGDVPGPMGEGQG